MKKAKTVWPDRQIKGPLLPLQQLGAEAPDLAAAHLAAHLIRYVAQECPPSRQGHASEILAALKSGKMIEGLEAGFRVKDLKKRVLDQLDPQGLVTWDTWVQGVIVPMLGMQAHSKAMNNATETLKLALWKLFNTFNEGRLGDVVTADGVDNVIVASGGRAHTATRLNSHASYEPRMCDFCWRIAALQRGTISFCPDHAGPAHASARKREQRIASAFSISHRARQLFRKCAKQMDRDSLRAAVAYEPHLRSMSQAKSMAHDLMLRCAQMQREPPKDKIPKWVKGEVVFTGTQIVPAPKVPDLAWSLVIESLPFVKKTVGSSNPVEVLDPLEATATPEAVELHHWLSQSPYNALSMLTQAEAWLEARQLMKNRRGRPRKRTAKNKVS